MWQNRHWVYNRGSKVFKLLFFVTLTVLGSDVDDQKKECGEIIKSDSTYKKGTLRSINHPDNYPDNARCLYYLVGLPSERVEIVFTKFEVTGVPPRCVHDYIDIYTQLQSLDEDLLLAPLQGRFCGKDKDNVPHKIISVSNILLVGLYTDSSGQGEGFELDYQFIPDDVYRVGKNVSRHLCGTIIDNLKNGTILSPTYPGVYPDNITCFYKFEAEPGERIKLNFTDVDLYFGGKHCPFDYIKVFDGPTNEAHVIDTFCGQFDGDWYAIYSTSNFLQVYFVTKTGRKSQLVLEETQGDKVTQLKGFKATFEIGRQFVDLNLIKEGEHLPGSECDRLVRSENQTNGSITSPYDQKTKSYPLNKRCHFVLDGLIDKQNLENVKITIKKLDLGDPPDEKAPIGRRCLRGFLHVFKLKSSILKVTENKDRNAMLVPDHEYCGKGTFTQDEIISDNPRLLLIFDTRDAPQGQGFLIEYQFSTDYAIPGTPENRESRCHFSYRSISGSHGTFNSPRHPSFYPDHTYCVYEFFGEVNEIVRITFENFQVEESANCSKDYVRILKVMPSSRIEKEHTMVGQYCGEKFPGPQDEDSQNLRVSLTSDGDGVRKGFRAKYEFIKRPPDKRCFHNETSEGSGIIKSPNYPHKYTTNITCEWFIWGSTKLSRFLLMFDIFSIEGNPMEKIGCGNAVLKIYTTRSAIPTYEMCGDNKTYENLQITTETNYLRLKFVSSGKATGGKGFRLPWTELLPLKGGKCTGFKCVKNNYCIPSSLKCDKIHNCGKGDDSDETKECLRYSEGGAFNVILIVIGVCILLLIIAAGIWWYRRKTSIRDNKRVIETKFMARPISKNIPNGISYQKERTEKVSMV